MSLCSCHLIAKIAILLSLLGLVSPNCSAEAQSSQSLFNSSFYSETVYDSRIDGAVTDSRLRASYSLIDGSFKPFAGIHFSRDLTNGSAPKAIENAWSPSLGLAYQLPRWASLLIEKRYLFRTNPQNRPARDEELRYGMIVYEKAVFQNHFFVEGYAELIAIDRVSSDPVLAAWLKLGRDLLSQSVLNLSPYGEAFTRQSPQPGYGPLENEIRLGLRLSTSLMGVNISALTHHALYSNVKPGGFDALIVISGAYF